MSRLQQCKQTADISCNVVDVSCCAPITVNDDVNDHSDDTDFGLVSDDKSDVAVNDNVQSLRDDHNDSDMGDNVGDDKHDDVVDNDQINSLTDDLASCQQVAEEQLKDESLKGCFKLAKVNKRCFELHDNLLYHRKIGFWRVVFTVGCATIST